MNKRHLISFATIFLLLIGCATVGEVSQGDEREGAQDHEGMLDKPVELEAITTGSALPTPDPILEALNEELNMNLRMNTFSSADDYFNQLNVRMAAGNLPDIIHVQDRQKMSEYAEKGMLLDLTPYVEQLQPSIDFVGEDNWRKGNLEGKQYGIPRIPDVPFATWWVRKDWLDELGLAVPTNLEELATVAEAFTLDDPDRNGQNDTYGLTGAGIAAFNGIFSAYNVGNLAAFILKITRWSIHCTIRI